MHSVLLSCIFAAACVCETGSAGHVIISHVELCCSMMQVRFPRLIET
jgi:hypothetical protein